MARQGPSVGLALIARDEESSLPIDDAFGHWLAGFIDGEGCFLVTYASGKDAYGVAFTMGLRDDDGGVLQDIALRTGIGRLYHSPARRGSQPRLAWRVYNKRDVLGLVELLDRYPLRAKKAADYAIWREAALIWRDAGGGRLGGAYQAMARLKAELEAIRQYQASA